MEELSLVIVPCLDQKDIQVRGTGT